MRIFRLLTLASLISLCGLSPLPLASAQNPVDVTINALAWSPDGQKIAAASTDGVYVWNAEGTFLTQLAVEGGARSLAWHPDSVQLAIGRQDGYVALWNVETDEYIQSRTSHSTYVVGLIWNNAGTQLVSAGEFSDAYIVWKIPSFKVLHSTYGNSYGIALNPDNTQLVIVHGLGLTFLNFPSLSYLGQGLESPEIIGTVDWSSDGTQLVSGSAYGKIYIWDALTHEILRSWQAHAGGIYATRWSPEHQIIASADAYHTIRFWDANTGYLMGELLNASSTFAWSPDGQKLVYAGEHSSIQIIQISEILS